MPSQTLFIACAESVGVFDALTERETLQVYRGAFCKSWGGETREYMDSNGNRTSSTKPFVFILAGQTNNIGKEVLALEDVTLNKWSGARSKPNVLTTTSRRACCAGRSAARGGPSPRVENVRPPRREPSPYV